MMIELIIAKSLIDNLRTSYLSLWPASRPLVNEFAMLEEGRFTSKWTGLVNTGRLVTMTTLLRMRRVGSEYFHWICPSCSMMRPTRTNKPNGYLLGSYRIATAPDPNSSRLTSLKSISFDSPANKRRPVAR